LICFDSLSVSAIALADNNRARTQKATLFILFDQLSVNALIIS
jgi:hypothetical protein